MQSSVESKSKAITDFLKQLNGTNLAKPLWVNTNYPADSLIHFVRPQTDLIDMATLMYLGALGFKIQFYNNLQIFLSSTKAQIPEHAFPKNTLIFTAEADESALLNIANQNYFTAECLNSLYDCVKALTTIITIYSKNCGNISLGLSFSGFMLTCKGSRPDISTTEILDILYSDLGLGVSGFKIKWLKEHSNELQTCFHLEFVSFFRSNAIKSILSDNFTQKVTKAIANHIDTRKKKARGALLKLNLPTASITETTDIVLFTDKVLQGKPPILTGKANQVIAQKTTLLQQFSELTANIFPQAKWVGIISKEEDIILCLMGLTEIELHYCVDALQQCTFRCEVKISNDKKFLQLFDLKEFQSGNIQEWKKVFVEKKLLLMKLKENEALFTQFKTFLLKADLDKLYLTFDIENNEPVIKINGTGHQPGLLQAYLSSWQQTDPSVYPITAKFYFNTSSIRYRVDLSHFSAENAVKFGYFSNAFWSISTAFAEYTILGSSVKFEAEKIVYNLIFNVRDQLKIAKLFFSYLEYRYPSLRITTTLKKDNNTVIATLTAKEQSRADKRDLFELIDLPRMSNDFVLLAVILSELPAIKKKYAQKLTWDQAANDIKLALGKALVKAIDADLASIVHCYFKFNEWTLDTPLPIKCKSDPMSYAQEIGSNECYRYLHAMFSANISATIKMPVIDFVSTPDRFNNDFMDLLSKYSGSVPKEFQEMLTEKKATKIVNKPTPETPVAVKFLQSFCQSAKIPSRWELKGDEDSQYLTLTHKAEVRIGLLFSYFKDSGLTCDWHENELVITLDHLNKWHIEVFSEAQGGVNAINNVIAQFTEMEIILDKILSIARTIMGVSHWSATPTALECTIREMTNSEMSEIYEAKCANILLLLEWTQVKCKLIEALTSSRQSNTHVIQISYNALNKKEWENLSESILKNSRRLGSSISQIPSSMKNIAALDSLLEEENKKLSLLKQNQPLEEKIVPSPAAVPRQREKDKSDKKPKKQDKPKKSNVIPKSTTVTPPATPSKKNNDKRSGPRLPPQNERRLQAIEKIRPASHQNLSAAPNRGIDLSLFAPKKSDSKSPDLKSNDVLQLLPVEMDSEELLILNKLEYWINQLNQLIGDYCKHQPAQDEIMDYIAAWHDLHSQIAGLLSILRDDHPAKKFIFNQHLYYGRRTFDRQKHIYFPDCSPSNKCFQDLGSLLAAIALLSQEHYPLDTSIADANRIIQDWSSYIDAEFAHNDITKLTQDMDQNAFIRWINNKISDYTLRIKNSLNKDHNFVTVFAIRFYVNRVGELTGHIPKAARTSYLQFCRHFRNTVFHNQLKLVELDLEKLQLELQAKTSPRFFRHDSQLPTWELYINNSYEYQSQDVRLLTQLHTQELAKRMTKPVSIITCEALKTIPEASLYKLLAKDILELDQKVDNACAYGMLLIPLEIKSHQQIHAVLSMKFIRVQTEQGSEFQLKEICFASIFNNNALIKEYIEAQVKPWVEYSLQKQMPAIRLHESIKLKPEQNSSIAVLQIELFSQLAERRLAIDQLLNNQQPKIKAKTTDKYLTRLRSLHIELAWRAGHHELYFCQQLMKKSMEHTDSDPAITMQPQANIM